uniref:Cytochrome c oxidase subunit 8 n=1 Tax=Castor canadensis TaxID=51338 RepID=A0A8C0WBL6_CASCN
MARLLEFCPCFQRHRVVVLKPHLGRRLTHSGSRRQQITSPMKQAIGVVVLFTVFLTPAAYVLGNLEAFKKG